MARILLFILVSYCTLSASAQVADTLASLPQPARLEDCLAFAIRNQPRLRQAELDKQIVDSRIREGISAWYPQVGLNFNLLHNLQLPTAFLPDGNGNKRPVTTGVRNSSTAQFSLSQSIFNRDVFLVRNSASTLRNQALEQETDTRIDVVANVSRAFYDLLRTEKQVAVWDENILRLRKSLQNAYDRYEGGIVDKIDYKRAQIALNTTVAQRKAAVDAIPARKAALAEAMGVTEYSQINISYDSLQMERAIPADTLQLPSYSNRIEYKLLNTQKQLQELTIQYERWSFLPNLSAIAQYAPAFQNDQFSRLYSSSYPTSFIGLQLGLPIFQGGRRTAAIRTAVLQLQRIDEQQKLLVNQINSGHSQALANYKASVAALNAIRENLVLTTDVYNTLQLQYNAGIKTYLDVVIAESDLRTTQVGYLNALYEVLSAKLDLQRALGTLAN